MNLYCFEWTEYQVEATVVHQLFHTLAASEETAKAAMKNRMVQIAMAVEQIRPLDKALELADQEWAALDNEMMKIICAAAVRREKMPKNGRKDVQAWDAYQKARATEEATINAAEKEFNARPEVVAALAKRDMAEQALVAALEAFSADFGEKAGMRVSTILLNPSYYDEDSLLGIVEAVRSGADFEIVQLDVIMGV
jgi:hypothetical protein